MAQFRPRDKRSFIEPASCWNGRTGNDCDRLGSGPKGGPKWPQPLEPQAQLSRLAACGWRRNWFSARPPDGASSAARICPPQWPQKPRTLIKLGKRQRELDYSSRSWTVVQWATRRSTPEEWHQIGSQSLAETDKREHQKRAPRRRPESPSRGASLRPSWWGNLPRDTETS